MSDVFYEITVADRKPVALDALKGQVQAIQHAMREVMQENVHYGCIPGCGDKPTLLKPGAEKICLMFRLLPRFEVTKTELGAGHREYSVICTLHAPSGEILGQGIGCASTLESKYRWRDSQRTCPKCGATAIILSKDFQTKVANGWLCFAKKGGCGQKFHLEDPAITKQQIGRMENPDIADVYNTVLKMAQKRAHVGVTIMATAAGDIFTQDLEDLPEPAMLVNNSQRMEAAAPQPPAQPGSSIPKSRVEAKKPASEELEGFLATLAQNGDLRGKKNNDKPLSLSEDDIPF